MCSRGYPSAIFLASLGWVSTKTTKKIQWPTCDPILFVTILWHWLFLSSGSVSLPCRLVHYRLLRHGHRLPNILPIESAWPHIVFLAVQFELTGCELSPHTSQIELPCCQIKKRKGYVVFGYTGTWRFPQPWWHSEAQSFLSSSSCLLGFSK